MRRSARRIAPKSFQSVFALDDKMPRQWGQFKRGWLDAVGGKVTKCSKLAGSWCILAAVHGTYRLFSYPQGETAEVTYAPLAELLGEDQLTRIKIDLEGGNGFARGRSG